MHAIAHPAPAVNRRHYIGGSDIAAILGLSPWVTPLEMALRKMGLAPDQPDNPAMAWGRRLEPVIAEAANERLGGRLQYPVPPMVSDTYPWLRVSLDGRYEEAGRLRVWEAKTARDPRGWGEQGTAEVPLHYLTQVLAYCEATGAEGALIHVLVGANDLREYYVPHDAEAAQAMLAEVADWWARVQDGWLPDPSSTSDVALRYPRDNGRSVTASDEVVEAVETLRALRTQARGLESEIDRLEGVVRLAIGEASALLHPDGRTLATFKAVQSKRFDTKAALAAHPELSRYYAEQTSRRFLLKEER